MIEGATITLGGKPYKVRPLTVGQIMAITEKAAEDGGFMSRVVDTIAIGLSREHPNMTRDHLLTEVESDMAELMAAFQAVQALSGLVPPAGEGGGAGPLSMSPKTGELSAGA
jgi:hypothetical protein